jgi:hypothetical protein
MPTKAALTVHRIHVSRTWFALETAYLVLITALAVVGMTTEARRPLLIVAALLALPCGLAAIVGLYALTGLFNWVAAGFSTYSFSQTTGGCDVSGHCWSRTTGTPVGAQGFLFSTCIVLLFVGAALVNVLLLRSVIRKRGSDLHASSVVAESDS